MIEIIGIQDAMNEAGSEWYDYIAARPIRARRYRIMTAADPVRNVPAPAA